MQKYYLCTNWGIRTLGLYYSCWFWLVHVLLWLILLFYFLPKINNQIKICYYRTLLRDQNWSVQQTHPILVETPFHYQLLETNCTSPHQMQPRQHRPAFTNIQLHRSNCFTPHILIRVRVLLFLGLSTKWTMKLTCLRSFCSVWMPSLDITDSHWTTVSLPPTSRTALSSATSGLINPYVSLSQIAKSLNLSVKKWVPP